MSRRPLLVAAAAVLVAALLVGVGRWEHDRATDEQVRGIRAVLAAIGGKIDAPTLSGFRYGPPDCLSYHDGTARFAYQLCFDRQGRVIESVDRTGVQPVYSSLQFEPTASPVRFPEGLVARLLRDAEAASH